MIGFMGSLSIRKRLFNQGLRFSVETSASEWTAVQARFSIHRVHSLPLVATPYSKSRKRSGGLCPS